MEVSSQALKVPVYMTSCCTRGQHSVKLGRLPILLFLLSSVEWPYKTRRNTTIKQARYVYFLALKCSDKSLTNEQKGERREREKREESMGMILREYSTDLHLKCFPKTHSEGAESSLVKRLIVWVIYLASVSN